MRLTPDNLLEAIALIIGQDLDTHKKLRSIGEILSMIDSGRCGQSADSSDSTFPFNPTAIQRGIVQWFFSWSFFIEYKIPYGEWADILDKAIELTKRFIADKDLVDYRKLAGYSLQRMASTSNVHLEIFRLALVNSILYASSATDLALPVGSESQVRFGPRTSIWQ